VRVGVAAALATPSLAGTRSSRRTERNAVAAAKAKPFPIGSPFPLHSFYAADGEQMKNGSGLAIDEINDAGGIAGRKIGASNWYCAAPMLTHGRRVRLVAGSASRSGWMIWDEDRRVYLAEDAHTPRRTPAAG